MRTNVILVAAVCALLPAAPLPAAAAQWSADSKVLAMEAGDRRVEVYGVDGALLWSKSFDVPIKTWALSPDGTRLAYAFPSDGVWLVDLRAGTRAQPRKLAASDLCAHMRWSPDSRVIVYSILSMDAPTKSWDFSGRPRLYLYDAASGTEKELKP